MYIVQFEYDIITDFKVLPIAYNYIHVAIGI